MIDHVDRTLERLLREKIPLPPPDYDISFVVPDREQFNPAAGKLTVNIYLHDVRENHELRDLVWTVELQPDGTFLRRRPRARIDLFYVVSTWSPGDTRDIQAEHRLLSDVLATLLRYPRLPEDVLEGALVGQEPPLPTLVAQLDGLPHPPAEFWTALNNRLRPSLSLVVTVAVQPGAADLPPRVLPVGSDTLVMGQLGGVVTTLEVRPRLRGPVGAGTAAHAVGAAPVSAGNLAQPIRASDREIAVADPTKLELNRWLLLFGGADSDFFRAVTPITAGATSVTVTPPLRFAHAAGAALDRPADIALKPLTLLSLPAAAAATTITVPAGVPAAGWLQLDDEARTEFVFVQSTTAAGTMALKHPLRRPHDAGRALRQVKLGTSGSAGTTLTTLSAPANQSGTAIELDAASLSLLHTGDVVQVGRGPGTEFTRLSGAPALTPATIAVAPPLRGNHVSGEPVRTVAAEGAIGGVARATAADATEVSISGEGADGLRPGSIVRLGGSASSDYHEVATARSEPGAIHEPGEVFTRIAGRVTDDAEPTEPVSGARVEVVGQNRATVTDAAGRFTFADLPSGPHTLRTTCAGFVPRNAAINVPPQSDREYAVTLSPS